MILEGTTVLFVIDNIHVGRILALQLGKCRLNEIRVRLWTLNDAHGLVQDFCLRVATERLPGRVDVDNLMVEIGDDARTMTAHGLSQKVGQMRRWLFSVVLKDGAKVGFLWGREPHIGTPLQGLRYLLLLWFRLFDLQEWRYDRTGGSGGGG